MNEHLEDETVDQESTRRRPSSLLLIAGVFALLVSAWALIGPGAFSGFSGPGFAWITVIGAVVVGLALLFSGRRRH